MANLSERVFIHCPYVRAREYLHEALEPSSALPLPQLLELRASLPVAHVPLAKTVRVEYHKSNDPMHFDEPWHVRWTPEPGGIYPSFEGRLTVHADDDYRNSIIELTGNYTPPLGAPGRVFDEVLGKRIAAETAQDLLARIAAEMVARYDREEAAKP